MRIHNNFISALVIFYFSCIHFKYGYTALAYAADYGHHQVMRGLINAGADLNVQNKVTFDD